MPPLIPSRRSGKVASAAKLARNVTFARAAAALVRTKLRRLPGRKPRRTVTTPRAAAFGAIVAGAAGAIATTRRKRAASPPTPPPRGPVPPPAPANYDAPGPPQNSATPLPAIETAAPGGIDEEAEIRAAAAEAAAIGGGDVGYASSTDAGLDADEAEAAVLEGGGGEAEGQEQTEADLVDLVTTDIGPGAGMTDAERQIEEAIEQQSNPRSGEVVDPTAPPGGEDSGPVNP